GSRYLSGRGPCFIPPLSGLVVLEGRLYDRLIPLAVRPCLANNHVQEPYRGARDALALKGFTRDGHQCIRGPHPLIDQGEHLDKSGAEPRELSSPRPAQRLL